MDSTRASLIRELVYPFLASQRLGVLGSISPDGIPQSALVGIAVTSELEIIFDTLNTSRKFRNLTYFSAVSLVTGWTGEVTVQYEGTAIVPEGDELARYREIYFSVWPECRAHLEWPAIAHVVIRPKWIRYSDYGVTPNAIEEFSF